jgi:HlyD family secretion protein
MTIADLGEIYAEANIDESDLGKISENLPVTIKAAAYPKLKIDGIITYVAPQAVQVQQIPTFKIKIKILLAQINEKDLPKGRKRNKLLFPGMSVDADIHVDRKRNVLQVPIETIWQKDGKDYVTIVTDKKELKDIEVTTGMKNNIMAEITNGVKEGEDIKIPEKKTPVSK